MLFIFLCFGISKAHAQSPYLSAKLTIDSIPTGAVHFLVEMKICEPIKRTRSGDHFTNDSSEIDFRSLTVKDINCGNYLGNGEQKIPGYQYRYGNQVFAWEKILVFKIRDNFSRHYAEPMYVLVPARIKSFVTFIEIKDVAFEAGKVLWIDEPGDMTKTMNRKFPISAKNRKVIDKEKSLLSSMLD